MSQYTPIIGSGNSGVEYRTKDNDGKQALLNHHKGSSAPSYAEAGCLWLDDASTPWELKLYDGTDWIVLSKVNSSENTANVINYATDITGKTSADIAVLDSLLFSDVSDSGNLKKATVQELLNLASGAPVGSIIDYAGTSVPTGYLNCDGSAISRTTYVNLFTAIGTAWGTGDGSTTFNLPNLSRRTTIGSGGTATSTISNTVGSTGGSETHTLTTPEIPAHTHTYDKIGTGGSLNGGGYGGAASVTGSTGGGGAHNNMQPSAVVMKIIKY